MSENASVSGLENIPKALHVDIDVQKMLSESRVEAERSLPQGDIIRLQRLANALYLAESAERQKLLLSAVREHADNERGHTLSGLLTHLAQRASNARKKESEL